MSEAEQKLLDTLKKIAKAEGRFDTDHQRHALNTITDMATLAVNAVKEYEPGFADYSELVDAQS